MEIIFIADLCCQNIKRLKLNKLTIFVVYLYEKKSITTSILTIIHTALNQI